MKFQDIKERVLTDRMFKGIVIGVVSVLLLEIVIILAICAGRFLPEREASPLPSGPDEVALETEAGHSTEVGSVDSLVYEYNIPISEYRKVEGNIRKGEFFSTLMSRLGASQGDIYALDTKAKGVFDMRQIKVGYHYHAYYTPGEPDTLAYVVYEKDNSSYVLFSLKDSISVNVYEKDIVKVVDYVEVNIQNSLWQDVLDAGAPALLAISLADIYAWSIDFFGLQRGDSFKAVYEKTLCDGEILDVERVLFAEFTHGDQSYRSYWFDDGSGNYYWNEKGESMRKAFLKAPLSYTRISSGFTYSRRHPITRKVRPHTGVDYAAPTGTEVMSIGDGVVVFKGFKTAEGNMVKIKHKVGSINSIFYFLHKAAEPFNCLEQDNLA